MGERLRRPGRPHPVTVAVAAACSLLVVAGVVIAWQRPGFAEVPPQPVDRSVWVVNDARLLVGRVNTGIGELDSATALRGVSSVVQDPAGDPADPLLVVDGAKDEIQLLDTATVTFGARVAVPADAVIGLRSGTVAVADPADGRVWVGTTRGVGPNPDLSAVDVRSASPAATVGPGPVLAVSVEGVVFAVRAGAATIVRIDPGDPVAVSDLPLAGGALSTGVPLAGAASGGPGDVQITAVGGVPVVLDRADRSVRVGDRRLAVTLPADAVLQEPGPGASDVLVSSASGLVAVNLADGSTRTLAAGGGTAVPPVVTAACRYAAWSSGVRVTGVASCADAPAEPVDLAGSGTAGRSGAAPVLTLQARGDAVVLVDATADRSWIASDGFRPVDNWSDVDPRDGPVDRTTTVENPTSTDDLPDIPPDCTAVPVGAPTAVDDDFGVRAGRTTVLRVLDNDPGVDCTSVVVESVGALPPETGAVTVVGDGSAVQVTLAPGVAAVPSIDYTVGSGRGATASARISIRVQPAGVREPAERVRRSAATAEVDATVSYNVLDDMLSPTGDDLFLVSAATDTADVVSFRPDGTITYRNTGAGAGTDVPVEFVVSDGVEQTTGTLTVSVVPVGSSAPVIYPAHGRTAPGLAAVVDLRRTVVSGSADPVVIDAVRAEPGSESATAVLDRRTGSVTVSAAAPDSYYFTFEATAGGRGTTGVLRVDVTGAAGSAGPPVPMLDVAYLPAGGETVIDPTLNDGGAARAGSAVQDVQPPVGAGLTAAVVDLHLVRISAARPLREPVDLTYAAFDGAAGSGAPTGTIRVVPVPAARVTPPPLTAPAQATVRAGDAVTIPFTTFTTSQDGSPVRVTVDPAQVAALPGSVFVTADSIRYLAPVDATPGQLGFGYTASSGTATALAPAQAAGTVTVTVVAADPTRNRPPDAPPPAVARVFAGSAISVSVPLAGVDPDGDWVTVQSIEQPEAPLGQVRVTGADTLTYTAFDAPGVDRIRYVATDPAGATAIGELTVLVVAPSAAARPPVAPDQTVSVRPGRSIRVDPLAAVVDPGGQAVRLADPAFTVTPGLDVQVEDRSFVLTAPAEPTVGTLRYTVVNAKGLTATGTVRVTVSPDAPMPDPVATDVFVQPADLTADTGTVDVDLTGSVTNRSGRADRLTVSVDPVSASVAAVLDAHRVRVTVSTVRQVIAYRVVDGNGAQAGAFIVVPPRAQLVGPQLRAGAGPIDLDAGVSADVAIADYVTVGGTTRDTVTIAPEPAPRLTQGTAVRTSPTTLTLSAPATAGGPAAVYVPIAVGSGPPVVLSIPVRIEPRLIPPPRIDSTEVPVEAGGFVAIDLAALTTTYDDRQAGSVSWGVDAGGAGVTATVRDRTVTVAAAADVPRGTRVELPMDVTDGDGKNGRGTLTVTVTGSTRPLPTVLDQQVAQGLGGTPVTVDMLTGSDDPVGLGLTVVGARVLDGAAGIGAGPTVSGGTVSVTPAAGFVGELVVAVDVLDGTRDPDRQVTATLRVQIQDRPGAPGVPSAVPGTVTARSVQLQWEPADANGSPVQQYTVSGGGIRQACPGSDSTCVVTGLTPGQATVFVVTASNAVGESPPSAPSAVIVPDVAPTVPAAPVAQYVARGSLSVSWSVPAGDFTPVTAMSLQVLRGDGGEVVQVIDAATSPTVLTGLDSAAGYRFQVRAGNQQGISDWSAPSDAVVPSGVPSAPTDLTAQFVFDAGRRGVEVTWGPPGDDGGEPVRSYRLTLGGADAGTGDGAWRSAFLPLEGNDPVGVMVVAGNGRGEGPAATATVAPFGRPATVTGLTVTPGDSSLALTWNPADSPGRPVADYQYRLDGGSWVGVGPATSATVGSLANGTARQVQVRACNGESGFSEDVRCGPADDPVAGTPAGPLTDPKVTVSRPDEWGRTIRVDWSFPGGNGREVTVQTVTIDDADVAPRPGTWSQDVGYGATVTATVAYCVGSGVERECREATARGATATLFTVATRALAPLTGTCATPSPYAGEWRTEGTCAPGTWVPAPQAADLLCVATGPAYPALPGGGAGPVPGDQVTVWYQDKDRLWYRKPVFLDPDSTIPTC